MTTCNGHAVQNLLHFPMVASESHKMVRGNLLYIKERMFFIFVVVLLSWKGWFLIDIFNVADVAECQQSTCQELAGVASILVYLILIVK